MMHKVLVLVLLGLSLVATSCFGLQIKSASNNETIFAKISSRELTRIFVSRDRIQSVRGIGSAYELTKDERMGAIFIRPTAYYQNKSFNIFITTEQGRTFDLLLTAMDIPAENIEIRSLTPSILATNWEKNSPYVETLTRLLRFMVNGIHPEGYAVINCHDNPVVYPGGLSMQLMKLYRGARITGEIWILKNNGQKILNFNAGSFTKPNTRAITLASFTLAPMQQTILYRITSNE